MPDKAGFGFLYPTPKDARTDRSPILTGRLVTKTGELIELAAWKKTVQKGERAGEQYLSIKHSDPRETEVDTDPDLDF